MDLAYAAADIYVGRSGASTLAEITLSGLPSVLIPYPHAAGDHQAFNARSLAARGGAVILQDGGLTGPALMAELDELLYNDRKRLDMAGHSGDAAFRRALEDILDILAEDLK